MGQDVGVCGVAWGWGTALSAHLEPACLCLSWMPWRALGMGHCPGALCAPPTPRCCGQSVGGCGVLRTSHAPLGSSPCLPWVLEGRLWGAGGLWGGLGMGIALNASIPALHLPYVCPEPASVCLPGVPCGALGIGCCPGALWTLLPCLSWVLWGWKPLTTLCLPRTSHA